MAESLTSKLANVVLALCAVAITARLVFGWGTAKSEPPVANVVIGNWEDVVSGGHRVGSDSARIHFVVFEDFECPVCGHFARATIPGVLAKYPKDVSFTFRHYPLSYHPAAYSAAVGAECAAAQGEFETYRHQLFLRQNELDSSTVLPIGLSAGLPDSAAFAACLTSGRPNHAVETDHALGKLIGVPGTPAIAFNGLLLISASPDSVRFLALVDSIYAEL